MDPYASRAELYKGLFDAAVQRSVDSADASELGLRDQARNAQSDQNYRGPFLGTGRGLFRMGAPLAEG